MNKTQKIYYYLFNLFVCISSYFLGTIGINYMDLSISALVVTLLVFLLSIFSSIIIHEFGHLIFGLISGYSFVLFRLGNRIFYINENNKLRTKKSNINGSGILGQCLMRPKTVKKRRQILYHAGGGLFCLIIAIILFPILFYSKNEYVYGVFLGFILSLVQIGFTTQLIPLNYPMLNDGGNIYNIIKNKENRVIIDDILEINSRLFIGIDFKDLELKYELDDKLMNYLQGGTLAFWIIYKNLDCGNLKKAEENIEFLYKNRNKMLKVFSNNIEIIYFTFLCLFTNKIDEALNVYNLFDKRLKKVLKVLKSTEGYLVQYAKSFYIDKNIKDAIVAKENYHKIHDHNDYNALTKINKIFFNMMQINEKSLASINEIPNDLAYSYFNNYKIYLKDYLIQKREKKINNNETSNNINKQNNLNEFLNDDVNNNKIKENDTNIYENINNENYLHTEIKNENTENEMYKTFFSNEENSTLNTQINSVNNNENITNIIYYNENIVAYNDNYCYIPKSLILGGLEYSQINIDDLIKVLSEFYNN